MHEFRRSCAFETNGGVFCEYHGTFEWELELPEWVRKVHDSIQRETSRELRRKLAAAERALEAKQEEQALYDAGMARRSRFLDLIALAVFA